MSVSTQVREAGLQSLAQMERITGEDATKLRRWAKDKPVLFKIVLFGCVKFLEKGKA